jgi:hypothetical protein
MEYFCGLHSNFYDTLQQHKSSLKAKSLIVGFVYILSVLRSTFNFSARMALVFCHCPDPNIILLLRIMCIKNIT